MATEGRGPGTRLNDRLVSKPEAFEVFEAVRILEDVAARESRSTGGEPPPELGAQDSGAGIGDRVRFTAAAMLSFPGAPIVAAAPIDRRDAKRSGESGTDAATSVRLEVATFGLIGPAGVLPQHYTSLVIERIRRFRDHGLREFLDIFTHRAMSLLVRAWGKYRVVVQRGTLASRGRGAVWDEAPEPRDPTEAVLASLVGLGGRTLPGRMRVEEPLLLHYAGHVARQPAAALPLEQMVADAWGVPARVEQFIGGWLALEKADQTRLGVANAALGVDALAGARVWSIESTYCVRLGPVSLEAFLGWLPGGRQLGALSDLLTFHVGPTLEAKVRPVLRADEVPQTQLGGNGCSRLGWTSWLSSRRPVRDAEDACFTVRL